MGLSFLTITQPSLGQLDWHFYENPGDYYQETDYLSIDEEKSEVWSTFLRFFVTYGWKMGVATKCVPLGLGFQNLTKKLTHKKDLFGQPLQKIIIILNLIFRLAETSVS